MFEVDIGAVGQAVLFRSSLLSIISRVLHARFFIYRRQHMILTSDSVDKSHFTTPLFCVYHWPVCLFIVQLLHSYQHY